MLEKRHCSPPSKIRIELYFPEKTVYALPRPPFNNSPISIVCQKTAAFVNIVLICNQRKHSLVLHK